MFNYYCLNPIAKVGLDKFTNEFAKTEDVNAAEGILVRSAAMHDMEFSDNLLAVARAGAGVNNIPLDECAKKGIVVFNTPGANANGVKELVIAGMLLASRDIVGGIEWVKENKDDSEIGKSAEKAKKAYAETEVQDKKLGIIGLGAIGVKVANVAKHMGMEVYGYDPYVSVDAAWNLSRDVKHVTDVNEIYANCDYITIHVPLNDATKNTVNKETLALCKDGIRILNFARGGLVNNDDIKEALASGKAAAYVTDFPSDDVIGVDGVIAIPHLGASTPESEDNCAMMAADELIAYIEKGEIINSVNMPRMPLDNVDGARTCIISKADAAEAVKAIAGADAKQAVKGAIAYTVADQELDADALNAVDGVIKVRVIK